MDDDVRFTPNEIRFLIGYLLGLFVAPGIGLYMIATQEGRLRVIGGGVAMYGALLWLLPLAILLATSPPRWAPPGGIVRLLPVFLCFILPIPLVLYLRYAMTRFDPVMNWFSFVPLWLLGTALLVSWLKDFRNRSED